MTAPIFKSPVPETLEAMRQPGLAADKKTFTNCCTIVASAVAATLAICFDVHMVFSIFSGINGDDSDAIWNPFIMSMASIILALAIHSMSFANPDHAAVRFINKNALRLIPVVLIGLAALSVVSLYNNGVGSWIDSLLMSDDSFDLDTPNQESVTHIFVTQYLTPIAGLLFTLSMGSLTLICLYVANAALSKIEPLVKEISSTRRTVTNDNRNIKGYQAATEDYFRLQTQIDNLLMRDEKTLRGELADDVLLAIQEGLSTSIERINQEKLRHDPAKLSTPDGLNVSALEKLIKPIQSITRNDILKLLH